jgi:hypothetical protein
LLKGFLTRFKLSTAAGALGAPSGHFYFGSGVSFYLALSVLFFNMVSGQLFSVDRITRPALYLI